MTWRVVVPEVEQQDILGLDQTGSHLADALLGLDVQIHFLGKRIGARTAGDRDRPAMHTFQASIILQYGQIPPDGCLRNLKLVDQMGHKHLPAFQDHLCDLGSSLGSA